MLSPPPSLPPVPSSKAEAALPSATNVPKAVLEKAAVSAPGKAGAAKKNQGRALHHSSGTLRSCLQHVKKTAYNPMHTSSCSRRPFKLGFTSQHHANHQGCISWQPSKECTGHGSHMHANHALQGA